jgi:hypothetical protein
MSWSIIAKALALMAAKKKMNQVSRHEIYAKTTYLPILYLLVTAPALLMLVSITILGVTGVAQLYPEYFFPTDFSLALAGGSLLLSAFTFVLFRIILKQLMKQDKLEALVAIPQKIEMKLEGAFSPIFDQLKNEQSLIKQSFIDRRNSHEKH